MTAANREGIAIIGRTTVEELGDRSEVEWQLSATPELEGAEIFELAVSSDRKGSTQWSKAAGRTS